MKRLLTIVAGMVVAVGLSGPQLRADDDPMLEALDDIAAAVEDGEPLDAGQPHRPDARPRPHVVRERLDAVELRPAGVRPMIKLHAARPLATAASGGPKPPQHRIRHLRIAVANLDAAGFPGIAKRMRLEAKKIQQQMQQQGDPALRQAIRHLKIQVHSLQRTVRRLEARVAELEGKPAAKKPRQKYHRKHKKAKPKKSGGKRPAKAGKAQSEKAKPPLFSFWGPPRI